MKDLGWLSLLSLVTAVTTGTAVVATPVVDLAEHVGRSVDGTIHLPLSRRLVKRSFAKRGDKTGQIGLGNYFDASYSVSLKIGAVTTSLVLDTGSSDLWVISDACVGDCKSDVPLYPSASFQSSGIDTSLFYGDSKTGTSAFGLIGKDTVSLAGISLQNQYFAAINRTNTSVLDSGDTGIFGLGFPINSDILAKTFVKSQGLTTPSSSGSLGRRSAQWKSFAKSFMPEFSWLGSGSAAERRQEPNPEAGQTSSSVIAAFLNSFGTFGPFIPRLVISNAMPLPQYTVTLQRDSIQIGGNAGLLTLGGLPSGVKNDSLTWVPVRLYSKADGGIPGPSDSPNEAYPLNWEVPLDDVYLDGKKLPKSRLVPSTISYSALIDTGNSIIRGPPDLVNLINDAIGDTFNCSSNHTLTFQIGGKMFPIDARDFATQAASGSARTCVATLTSTDVPKGDGSGFLFSWSLGDPFLRSVLASFYMGNLTHPSLDPPRMGLLSTVPSDDGAQLKAAVSAARVNLPQTRERAPTATGVPKGASKTNSVGVLQAPTQASSSSSSGSGGGGSKSGAMRMGAGNGFGGSLIFVGMVLLGAVIG